MKIDLVFMQPIFDFVCMIVRYVDIRCNIRVNIAGVNIPTFQMI